VIISQHNAQQDFTNTQNGTNMNDITTDVPDQFLTTNEKKKDDFQHYKDTADAYISMAGFGSYYNGYDDNDAKLQLYRIYNGEKIEEHYAGFEDPYGTKDTTNPMPLNDVKPWNILRSNTDIIINEKSKRMWQYMAVNRGEDVLQSKSEEVNAKLIEAMRQEIVNIANEQGRNTGVQSKPVGDLSALKLATETKFIDKRAMRAQKIMKVALSEQNVKDKLNRIGMKHWVISGDVCTYKGIRQNGFVYEVINPLKIRFIGSKDIRYGRDMEAAVRIEYMSVSDVMKNFYDLLDKEQIDRLKSGPSSSNDVVDPTVFRVYDTYANDSKTGELIQVIHIAYRSFYKKGIITYLDEFDEEQMIEVDDTFDKKAFGYTVVEEEWEWENCVDEVYRIDGDMYAGAGRIGWLSHDKNNPRIVPLPYNCAFFSNLNTENTSLVKESYIYQFLFNVYKAKMERLISVDKGQVSIIDVAALKKYGLGQMDIDKAMYYIESQHILWVDSSADDFGKFQQWGSKLDFSQHNAIAALIQVVNQLKDELDTSMGITPQRRGEVANSAGKATTEYAIERSYVVSEGIFVDFENFEEEELNDILNVAKIVYSNMTGMYMVEGMPVYLDPSEGDIEEEDLGIYMSKASADKRKLETMRAIAQPFAQNVGKNGITPEMIASIAESDSMSEIKIAMQKADNAVKSYEQQIRNHEMEMQNQKIQAEKTAKQADQQFEAQENALDREKDVSVARIKSAGFEEETSISDINTPGIDKDAAKVRAEQNKNATESKRMNFERQKHKDEMEDKEKERKNKIQLKKMDLKNKVVGEK